jgi:hypothetical protein
MTNTIKDTGIIDKMSFTDYYNRLKTQHVVLRDEIILKLEISEKTFYNKFNENRFSYPEKIVISQLLDKPINDLFPEV